MVFLADVRVRSLSRSWTSDRSNVLEGFDENEPDPEEPKTQRVAPKRRNYDHLPTKTEVVALPVE